MPPDKTSIEVLEERFKGYMEATEIYRENWNTKIDDLKITQKEIFDKLDGIFEKLTLLPCEKTKAEIRELNVWVRFLAGGFLSVIILGIVMGLWVRVLAK